MPLPLQISGTFCSPTKLSSKAHYKNHASLACQPSLAEVSFITEDKLMVKEGVQDVVCPPLLSNPALGCSACCCNKGAVPEEAARAVAGQSPSTQASKEQQVTLSRHSGSSLLPEKGSRIPKSSCFLWVIDSQPQVLSMATEIAAAW